MDHPPIDHRRRGAVDYGDSRLIDRQHHTLAQCVQDWAKIVKDVGQGAVLQPLTDQVDCAQDESSTDPSSPEKVS